MGHPLTCEDTLPSSLTSPLASYSSLLSHTGIVSHLNAADDNCASDNQFPHPNSQTAKAEPLPRSKCQITKKKKKYQMLPQWQCTTESYVLSNPPWMLPALLLFPHNCDVYQYYHSASLTQSWILLEEAFRWFSVSFAHSTVSFSVIWLVITNMKWKRENLRELIWNNPVHKEQVHGLFSPEIYIMQ